MDWNLMFFTNSIMLGVGLAMDAFSVSLANGLNDSKMKPAKMCAVAGVFSFFQGLMPLAGWVCIHTIVQYFTSFEKLIPWIAFGLLGYIGGKMLYDSIKGEECDGDCQKLTVKLLIVQGVATSIDALSVGFTIADYNAVMALVSSLIIAAVTFVICMCGIAIGKKFGTKLSGKASILGGLILIFIGTEILVTSFFK